ncbi:MAG: hypothetical protein JWO73_531 [Candidatus Taylorbacteria bacterium]|nr:hypothetical protein [Candidatus Taylorbacteria bacterium]
MKKYPILYQKFIQVRKQFKNLRSMAEVLKCFPGFENIGHTTLVRWAKGAKNETLGQLANWKLEKALDLLEAEKTHSDSNAVTKEAKELLRQTRLFIVQAKSYLSTAVAIERRLKAAVQKKH